MARLIFQLFSYRIRLLPTLCGFYECIRLIFCASCAAFASVYGFSCALSSFWFVESLDDPILRALLFVESLDDPILRVIWFVEGLNDSYLRVLWFVESLDDPIFDFLKVLMIRYLGFFIRRFAHYDLTVWKIRSSEFRQVLYLAICTQFTVRSYLIKFTVGRISPWRFLVDFDRVIYLSKWSNITVHYAALW